MATPSYRHTAVTYLRPHRVRVLVLCALLAVTTGLALLAPLLLQRFIDGSVEGMARSVLVAAAVAYLVAGLADQVVTAVSSYLGADLGWRATNRLREDLAAHLLDLDMEFHTNTTPGEMIERIDGDVTAVADFLSRFLVRLVGAGLLLIGVLGVVWWQSVYLGVGYSLFVVLVLTVVWRLRDMAVDAAEEERESSALLYGFIEERLAAVDEIRANGAGAATMHAFDDVMGGYYRRTTRAWQARARFRVVSNTLFWVGSAAALGLGAWLVTTGRATVGTAYLLYQYVLLIQTPIEQVTRQFAELQKAAGGIVRIDRLRALKPAVVAGGGRTLATGAPSVRFDGVGFAYERHPVLFDVSFELAPGTVLGLLGRTGGGKTTLTRLLSRLYDPDEGRVEVGGVDLRELDGRSLRRTVGVVAQDVQLFRASVRDNLTYFDRRTGTAGEPSAELTDARILERLDRAGLGPWIRRLGLDTELGDGGSGLSAGEAQLLAFARVFLADPGLVILDEPSSRLDPATEALVAAATDALFVGRTVVVIAHRLETVRNADEIMVVDGGRIVEHGSREALAAAPRSRYRALLDAAGVETDSPIEATGASR